LAAFRKDYARASVLHEEGLGMARAAGDVRGIAVHTNNLGKRAPERNDFERAEALLREARELSWKLGDWLEVSVADLNLGNLALAQNDFDLAEERCVKVVVGLRERAEVYGIDGALNVLASIAASRGEIRRRRGSGAGWKEAWREGRAMSLDRTVDYALEGVGDRAMGRG
jgi:tetratricopeptide (TPR) repeat protein